MNKRHKFYYIENGVYVITEEERPDYTPTNIKWDIFNDNVRLAVGYVRWSDEKQNKGHSLAIQEREIILRAKVEGYQVVVMFIEAATSGLHVPVGKRVKINEMKEFVFSNKNANTLIFYDETRVTRAIEDFYFEFIIPVKEEKLDFIYFSRAGKWDPNDPISQMNLNLGNRESTMKSYNISEYQNSAIVSENPFRPGSSYPYGYSRKNKDDDLIPDENAGIVKLIFFLYSFGYSDKKIAELLELSKIPSPLGYDNWSDTTIRYILTNHWYLGELAWFSRTSRNDSKKKPLDDFSRRWGRELDVLQKEFKKVIYNWKKVCIKETQELKASIENIRYKKSLVNPTIENYGFILEAIETQLKIKEKEKSLFEVCLEKVEILLKDHITLELIDRFKQDIHSYSNVEKRSIILLTINNIVYDFKGEYLAQISYRLTPYVDIESFLESTSNKVS
ncbi:Resolvase, N terminal domain [Lysinibacillus sp. AC-3]|uniref:recombinase family protein n=1 Tax=unclassified Lysinibacillus TaxID=2636778 RepID=UPI0009D10F7B|nr:MULTISPECIES: recombinase family protein [unclassified Lysinibacillus]SKC08831.1 Resolvase, N terminal domain [Lysinibacillus sp. AC-3]